VLTVADCGVPLCAVMVVGRPGLFVSTKLTGAMLVADATTL
jgi:hypothetical protein